MPLTPNEITIRNDLILVAQEASRGGPGLIS